MWMNFKVMPELDLPFGYYLALAFDGLQSPCCQTYCSWRRGWFRGLDGNSSLIEPQGADA